MEILKSINQIMSDIGAIAKNSRNKDQNFMFRGIDAVYNALNPALIKNEVFVYPIILDYTRDEITNAKGTHFILTVCKVEYHFVSTKDGSEVKCVVCGEGMDVSDKSFNKAMSMAFKYACFQTFCIPTEEMIDADSENPNLQDERRNEEPTTSAQKNEEVPLIGKGHIATLKSEIEAFGVPEKQMLDCVGAKSLETMNINQFKDAMMRFAKMKAKAEK